MISSYDGKWSRFVGCGTNGGRCIWKIDSQYKKLQYKTTTKTKTKINFDHDLLCVDLGTETILELNVDGTATVEKVKVGKPGQARVSEGATAGTWEMSDGQINFIVDGIVVETWDCRGDFKGRYGFRKS